MRAAIYDRYWHSMGGGERHSGMIAEVLSKDGVEVDLLGHSQVDRDELAEHLGLDLSRTTMRMVPDKGDAYVAALSAEYDLFVNATYMSVVTPQSAHAAYLCFFPTPFDHDLPAVAAAPRSRAIGPWLTAYRDRLAMGWGTGWYPPEGGRRAAVDLDQRRGGAAPGAGAGPGDPVRPRPAGDDRAGRADRRGRRAA